MIIENKYFLLLAIVIVLLWPEEENTYFIRIDKEMAVLLIQPFLCLCEYRIY